jgi:hypothetical protein
MVVPTRHAIDTFDPGGSSSRPLTPYELWHNYEESSYLTLQRNLHPFGCLAVAHVPADMRNTNQDHGEYAIYLCPAYPDKGTMVLFLNSGSIRSVHTLKTFPNRFPFLEELRKRIPHALQFAPERETDVTELEDDIDSTPVVDEYTADTPTPTPDSEVSHVPSALPEPPTEHTTTSTPTAPSDAHIATHIEPVVPLTATTLQMLPPAAETSDSAAQPAIRRSSRPPKTTHCKHGASCTTCTNRACPAQTPTSRPAYAAIRDRRAHHDTRRSCYRAQH